METLELCGVAILTILIAAAVVVWPRLGVPERKKFIMGAIAPAAILLALEYLKHRRKNL